MSTTLSALRAVHFRNLDHVELEADPGLNVFLGNNGQGKTNLLEAVHLCAALTPLRPAERVKELIRFGQDEAHLSAEFALELPTVVDVRIHDKGKRATIAGKPVRDVSSIAQRIAVVAFTPQDLDVVRAGPKARRRALDRFCYGLDPTFVHRARAYERALAARNRLLKEHVVDEAQLDAYGPVLIEAAAAVYESRVRALRALSPAFTEAAAGITEGGLAGTLRYRMHGLDAAPAPAAYAGELARSLQRARGKERARRTTPVGPHVDDIEIQMGEHAARRLASQGETRALVLAWKIAEVVCLTEARKAAPILLLDDVAGELDPARQRALFDVAEEVAAQVFVTTTHEQTLPAGRAGRTFVLDGGAVAAQGTL